MWWFVFSIVLLVSYGSAQQKDEPKVFEMKEDDIFAFVYHVVVRSLMTQEFCDGTLLDEKHVLAPRTCFARSTKLEEWRVIANTTYSWATIDAPKTAFTLEIETIQEHIISGINPLINAVLITLKTSVPMKLGLTDIVASDMPLDLNNIVIGHTMVVNADRRENNLKAAQFRLISYDECLTFYENDPEVSANLFGIDITFCVLPEPRDADICVLDLGAQYISEGVPYGMLVYEDDCSSTVRRPSIFLNTDSILIQQKYFIDFLPAETYSATKPKACIACESDINEVITNEPDIDESNDFEPTGSDLLPSQSGSMQNQPFIVGIFITVLFLLKLL